MDRAVIEADRRVGTVAERLVARPAAPAQRDAVAGLVRNTVGADHRDLAADPERARHAFLQCLIQVSVALHHARRQNWAGTRKLLASALGYLEKGRADSTEVDLDKLKDLMLEFALSVDQVVSDPSVALPFFILPRRP